MCVFFFFFKQKTAYEMRISDWSSDVCSSDLGVDVWLAPRLSGEPPERLTLLVQNDGGYRNLAKLLSAAYTEGQGTGQPLVSRESLVAWNGGLIAMRSEEHTSELQSLMRISYAVFCLKKKKTQSSKQQ